MFIKPFSKLKRQCHHSQLLQWEPYRFMGRLVALKIVFWLSAELWCSERLSF